MLTSGCLVEILVEVMNCFHSIKIYLTMIPECYLIKIRLQAKDSRMASIRSTEYIMHAFSLSQCFSFSFKLKLDNLLIDTHHVLRGVLAVNRYFTNYLLFLRGTNSS